MFELLHGSNTITTLCSFDGANGKQPTGNVLLDQSGDLFCSTSAGGDAAGDGAVFELKPSAATQLVVASQPTTVVAWKNFSVTLKLEDHSGNLLTNDSSTVAVSIVSGLGHLVGTASVQFKNGVATFSGLSLNPAGTYTLAVTDGSLSTTLASIVVTAEGTDTVSTVATFPGISPGAGLVMDTNHDLFGITGSGGTNNDGTIFELAQGSTTITTLASFTSSVGPNPGLFIDQNGDLFGTTDFGGTNGFGSIFELPKGSNTIMTLASVGGTTGVGLHGDLIMDSKGDLFGTTGGGGPTFDGSIFELAHGSSTIVTLASFDKTNGSSPVGELLMDKNGDLFGTTSQGGAKNDGVIFELAHGSSNITVLASFNLTNGTSPQGSLLADSSGDLFGTASGGGANGLGTVFELVHGSSTITALASFNGADGGVPTGLY